MPKKQYVLSIASLISIPIFSIVSIRFINLIDPEMALHSSDYERNFHRLTMVKNFSLIAVLLVNTGLWVATCLFLVRSKNRSYRWVLLALLGPIGLMTLTLLNDKNPTLGDFHQRFVSKLKTIYRAMYEFVFFIGTSSIAYMTIVLKRNLLIMLESSRTGASTTQILNIQNASSGMYAFSEGLETMCLLVLIYLLWPVCFNAIGHLIKKPNINE